MDNPSPDWSLIQSFLAVAETGSLSGAARRLDRSQPTVGRHIHALESSLGALLFERHARGLRLSDTGAALVPMARRMHEAMQAIGLSVAGKSQSLVGIVRITASVFVAQSVLPPVLAAIRARATEIQIELDPSDASGNLLFREADIAVRMYRPTQPDLIARHVGNASLGVFAATSYLDRAGRPETPAEMLDHALVGYDGNDLILRTMRDLGWPVSRESFAVRCDNQANYWALVRAGCGIGFSQLGVGRADPLVEELPLAIDLPPLPVWLAAPQALRLSPRIARVWDLLAEGLMTSGLIDRPAGPR